MKTSLVLFLVFFFGSNPLCAGELEEWVVEQPWFQALEKSMPEGTSLSLSIEAGEGSLWDELRIREVHRPGSGFDPDISPTVGFFRISKDRSVTEWLDPVSGEWGGVSDFLQSRRIASGPGTDPDSAENALAADLDRDGQLERVRWELIGSSGGSRFFQLFVSDDDGEVIWSGPDDATTDNAYVFFETHIGVSLPQLLHDIDSDGAFELLGPEPQSDVSATFWRRLRWKGGSFSILSSAPLLLDNPSASRFRWREGEHSFGIWVSRFGTVESDGRVNATVTRYTEDGDFASGDVLLRFDDEGASIEKWARPLGDPPLSTQSEWKPEVDNNGNFELGFKVSIAYSPACRRKLEELGATVTVSATVDQYGPQYIEEEAIASLDKTVAAGESASFEVIPLSRFGYQIDPEKAYRVTVSVFSGGTATERGLIEGFSAEGVTDWAVDEVQGRTLPFVCRLVGEGFEPEPAGDASRDPFSGIGAKGPRD